MSTHHFKYPLKCGAFILLFFGALSTGFSIYAQTTGNDSNFELRRIGVQNGLINQAINALCIDSSGLLWIGTANGLYTFDGVRLSRFDDRTRAVRRLPSTSITALKIDPAERDLIFITTNKGIAVIDLKSHCILSDTSIGLPLGFLRSCFYLETTPHGFLWLLGPDALYKLTGGGGANQYICNYIAHSSAGINSALLADPHDAEGVWILPSGKDIFYFQKKGFQHFSLPESNALSNNISNHIQWMYTDKGFVGWDPARNIFQFDSRQNSVIQVGQDFDLYDFFPGMTKVDNTVKQKTLLNCYYSTISGQQLFGTNLGLFIIREKVTKFYNFEALQGEEIRGLFEEPFNKYWVGTYNGLYSCGPNSKVIKESNLSHIWDFLPITENLWLLAKETPSGIVIWDLFTNKLVRNPDILGQIDKSKDEVTGLSVCKDNRGVLWAGTYNSLMWSNSQSTISFRHWEDDQKGERHKFTLVRSILADPKSGVWVGGGNGLLRIVYNERQKRYEKDVSIPTMKDISISDLYMDLQQRLWIATKGKGIACLDSKKTDKILKWYNEELGLCNNFACRIEGSHNDEVLWISTHNGLSRFNVKTETFHNYYEDSGFPGNEFNSASSMKCMNGNLIFGGLSGLISFHPDSIQINDFRHKTYISGSKYFDKASGSLVNLSLTEGAGIYLPPYPEYFDLQLGSTEYLDPEKMRYRYRLHGLSEIWTYTSGESEIKFIRLAPGKYTLEAQAVPLDGHISLPIQLSIFVAIPYYETWWFKTLLILGSGGLVYLAYQYRLRQLLYEQRLRRQIADDLHDDIGNKLNIISIIAQKLTKNPPERTHQTNELNHLIEISRNALRSLHTMIWSVDFQKDRLASLFDRMQDFADGYLRPLGIKFHFEISAALPNRNINLQARHHIILVFQELLTNMVKYTHPVLITIVVKQDHDSIHLRIINQHLKTDAEKVNAFSANRGLSSIERRMNSIKGKFSWVETSEDSQETNLFVPYIFKRF